MARQGEKQQKAKLELSIKSEKKEKISPHETNPPHMLRVLNSKNLKARTNHSRKNWGGNNRGKGVRSDNLEKALIAIIDAHNKYHCFDPRILANLAHLNIKIAGQPIGELKSNK